VIGEWRGCLSRFTDHRTAFAPGRGAKVGRIFAAREFRISGAKFSPTNVAHRVSRPQKSKTKTGGKPGTKTGNRKAGKRLALASAERPSQPWMIPTRYIKFAAGIGLLPLVWVLTQTFFKSFHRAAIEQQFWRTEEFWFFSLGAALWTLWFCGSFWALGRPWPLRVYVFGHELTHAIWVWAWQGRVKKFEGWSRDGGYIITDTHNFWIALAPYFYPIYSFAVIVAYAVASIFYDVANATETFLLMTPLQWLFVLLGATWAFHLSFTLWMIPKGQTDLTYHGTFFSIVIIYIMNVLLLALFLIVGAPEVSFASFAREFGANANGLLQKAGPLLLEAMRAAGLR